MTNVLSEEAINLHLEYLRSLKLRYSILEKSIISIKNKTPIEISRQKMKTKDKSDTLYLLGEVILHDVFFSSFGPSEYRSSDIVRSSYGSEAMLFHRLFSEGMKTPYGFLAIYSDGEKICTASSCDFLKLTLPKTPDLAIDLCEHAYFSDYGFDKEKYLLTAISHLDLSRLSKN